MLLTRTISLGDDEPRRCPRTSRKVFNEYIRFLAEMSEAAADQTFRKRRERSSRRIGEAQASGLGRIVPETWQLRLGVELAHLDMDIALYSFEKIKRRIYFFKVSRI